MKRRFLVMDEKDNVGVLLEDATSGDSCRHGSRDIEIRDDVAFGHKLALKEIAPNEPIVKYGQEIGRAEKAIRSGEWVHVHNMGCRRGK